MKSKVTIKKDVFNIAKRLKNINKNYKIVKNLQTQKYEIHNETASKNSFVFSVPYNKLDIRTLKHVAQQHKLNAKEAIKHIEQHNKKLEKQMLQQQHDELDYKFNEIYRYANSGSSEFETNSYSNVWI